MILASRMPYDFLMNFLGLSILERDMWPQYADNKIPLPFLRNGMGQGLPNNYCIY